MNYLPKVVLHCQSGYQPEMDALVERFRACGVKFIGVVGVDCELVESIIDELAVGDASDLKWMPLTSAHPQESLAKAVAFACALTGEFAGEVQVVEV
jgi:hypothetical protein